jgi:hypothetical protein
MGVSLVEKGKGTSGSRTRESNEGECD